MIGRTQASGGFGSKLGQEHRGSGVDSSQPKAGDNAGNDEVGSSVGGGLQKRSNHHDNYADTNAPFSA